MQRVAKASLTDAVSLRFDREENPGQG